MSSSSFAAAFPCVRLRDSVGVNLPNPAKDYRLNNLVPLGRQENLANLILRFSCSTLRTGLSGPTQLKAWPPNRHSYENFIAAPATSERKIEMSPGHSASDDRRAVRPWPADC